MKNRMDIYGTLAFPLSVGCAAFIKESNGNCRITSPVKHFVTLPSGRIYIQTVNTHYHLHLPGKASGKEVLV